MDRETENKSNWGKMRTDSETNQPVISDNLANIVENLACRLAEIKGGIVTPNDLFPYLPLSWSMINSILSNMVDKKSITTEIKAGFKIYKFTAIPDKKTVPGQIVLNSCVGCDKDLKKHGRDLICPDCQELINRELTALAKKNAWPAEAVYEHEIIYLASKLKSPIFSAILAGHSRYTLRNMKFKLQALQAKGTLKLDEDTNTGKEKVLFPEVNYPREMYKRNIGVICSFPASLQEEVEMRIVKIVYTLAILGLAVFAGAILLKLPFPVMITSFAVLAPVTAVYIWRHKQLPADL
jgi:hypothetical protein